MHEIGVLINLRTLPEWVATHHVEIDARHANDYIICNYCHFEKFCSKRFYIYSNCLQNYSIVFNQNFCFATTNWYTQTTIGSRQILFANSLRTGLMSQKLNAVAADMKAMTWKAILVDVVFWFMFANELHMFPLENCLVISIRPIFSYSAFVCARRLLFLRRKSHMPSLIYPNYTWIS